jgi:hypothetical protein
MSPSQALAAPIPCTALDSRVAARHRLARSQPVQACLVTRIEFPNRWLWLVGLAAYWKLRRRAAGVDGLVELAILSRRPRTIVMISWWTGSPALAVFNARVGKHAGLVNWVQRSRARYWSGSFVLTEVAPSSLSGVWR